MPSEINRANSFEQYNKEQSMATDKSSASSTPPATHDEHLAYHERHTSVAGVPAHQEHGPLVDHKIPQEDAVQAMPDLWWSRTRHTLREPFSEFFGTMILILFGDGVVAQVVLSGGANGEYQSITWGWG